MIDSWAMKMVRRPLQIGALFFHRRNVTATQISIAGFLVGMLALPMLYLNWYGGALFCILLNRIGDGLDGSVARLTQSTDAGGYLDITFDFIFYSAVVFGFALVDPENNGLAAAALIFSFIGTGSSFLAFGIMAERRGIDNTRYPNKGFYYLYGLIEGTETLIFLILFCLFPQYFASLAWVLATLCVLSTIVRIISGYKALSS